MLTGKEKAQLLLSIIGSESKNLLSRLSKESVALLTGSIEGAPEASYEDCVAILDEINKRIDETQGNAAAGFGSLEDSLEDELGNELNESEEASDDSEQKEAEDAVEQETDASADDDLLDDNLFGDDGLEDTDVQESSGPRIRNAEDIAQLLDEQAPQLASFIFSKLDQKQQNEVLEHASEDLKQTVKSVKVEQTPMAEKVFEAIKDDIFIEKEEEPLDSVEQMNASTEEIPSGDFGMPSFDPNAVGSVEASSEEHASEDVIESEDVNNEEPVVVGSEEEDFSEESFSAGDFSDEGFGSFEPLEETQSVDEGFIISDDDVVETQEESSKPVLTE